MRRSLTLEIIAAVRGNTWMFDWLKIVWRVAAVVYWKSLVATARGATAEYEWLRARGVKITAVK